MGKQMELKTENRQGGIVLAHVQADRLNMCHVQDFQHSMMSLMDQRYQVGLDVAPVRLVDGCGFGALLAVMRTHRVFDVYSNCEEAVGAFS
jgi:hypothetical protein